MFAMHYGQSPVRSIRAQVKDQAAQIRPKPGPRRNERDQHSRRESRGATSGDRRLAKCRITVGAGATRSAVVCSRIVFCLRCRRGIVPGMAEDAALIVLVI